MLGLNNGRVSKSLGIHQSNGEFRHACTLKLQTLLKSYWLILLHTVQHRQIAWLVWFMVFNTTFNNISAISRQSVLLVEETRVSGENHRPDASHWQTLSHNVVLSTKMTTTAGHSFYIGPIVFFYNQVNDTGSWEPLVMETNWSGPKLFTSVIPVWNDIRHQTIGAIVDVIVW
jgi:hypothetical protein